MSDLAQRIASLSPEKRGILEQRLMKKKASSSDGDQLIPRRNSSDPCYLSFCQQRLWFLDQLAPGSSTYNVPNAMLIRGPLKVEALRQSLEVVLRRHGVLRTTFACVKGVPLQVIAETWETKLPVVDVRALPKAEREAEARRILTDEARRPFDLAKDQMIRASLVRLDDQEYMLLLSTHHVAWDALSKAVCYREVAQLYRGFATSVPVQLPELPIQYADFAAWQRQWLNSDSYRKEVAYWKQQLGNAAHVLDLPTDRKRPKVQTFRGAKYLFALSKNLADRAKALSREQGVTLFMTLLSAFYAFLYSYTGQEDISVGSPIAGRNRPELERLIGFFINTMVLRTELNSDPSFREVLGRVRETTLGAFAHQDMPFDKLVEVIHPPRDLSRMALFQVNFRMAAAEAPQLELPGLEITPLELIDTATSKFDLALELAPYTEAPNSYWEYNTDLFEQGTIARMCGDFEQLLGALLTEPDRPFKSLQVLCEIRRRNQMETIDRDKPKMKSLKDVRRKAVDLSQMSMVKTSQLNPEHALPLVVEPAVDNVDLAEWARNNRDVINANLAKHGGILYHGFNIKSPADFERVAAGVCTELFSEYGDLPREGVAGKIYKSTPYPNDKMILFHNESSHLDRWPMKINFFCVKAAEKGGCSPIVDCREVAKRMDPKILTMFAGKGLMYVRNFSEGLDVSWQQFFHTDDRSVVEKACREASMTCEWVGRNNLRVRQVCRAVAKHPKTGETIFFNQVQLHHVCCLDSETRQSLMSLFKEEDLPRHVYFGDGTPISDEVMRHVGEVYESCAVRFPWQAGDMVTLDNMLVAHARDPFEGERKICVALGEMVIGKDIDAAAATVQQ